MKSNPVPSFIRNATTDDIPAMVELIRLLFSIEADFAIDAAKQRRGLELLISTPSHSCVLVAVTGDLVIGMCTGQIVISTAEGAPSVWVEDVVVAEAYRSQGVATKLLAHLEAWAKSQGATRLQLLTELENTSALKFYHRQSWLRTHLIALRKLIGGSAP